MSYDLAAYANLSNVSNSSSGTTGTPSLLSLSAAAAPSLTPVTLNPTADTYTESGSPATNFGSSGEVRVKKSSGTTANREALLKFDLSSLGGAPAASAVLRLYGKLQDTREANVVTDVFPTTTAWTESGVTWNNRPAATGAKVGSLTVKNTTGQYYEVDITSLIQAELAAGRTTVALLLANPNTASPYTTFNSRNAASNKPQLVITPGGPAINSAPSVNAGTDQVITLPASASLTGSVSDDGLPSGTVTTSWTKLSGPGTVTFGNGALASTTASFSAAGTYVLRLTANDGELVSSDDVTIIVNPAGAITSTLTPTADSYVEDGAKSTNFGTSGEMRVKRSSSAGYNREGLLKFDLSALSGAVTSVKLRLYGKLQDTREANVVTQVFATSTGWTETGVTWNNRPAATGVSLGSVSVQGTAGKYYEVDLTAFVQAEWAAGRDTIALLLRNPNTTSPYSTFASRNASTNRPQLVVSTAPQNLGPAVKAGTDQAVTFTSGAALSGVVSDDGLPGNTLATTWSLVSGPGAVTFGDASLPATSATFSAAGTYVLRLTASDGSLSSSDDVTILVSREVQPNAAPAVDAGSDVTMTSPAVASLDATVSDDGLPSNGSLVTAWSLVSGPGTVTFGDSAGVDTTATFSQPGTYVLRLTATDGALAASDDVTITFAAANLAPLAEAGGDQSVTWPASAVLTGVVSDDGNPTSPGALMLQWTQVAGPGTATFADASQPVTSVTFDRPGLYVLRLTASDGALSASDDVTITLNPAGPTQSPFGVIPISVPGRVEAESYDDGGEGLAYHDTTAANVTGAYREAGVDVEATSDTGGGYNVGHVVAGEWLEYTVNVTAAGSYALQVRFASATGGGTVHFEFDGVDKTGPVTLPGTGGWQTWQTVTTTPTVSLAAGEHVVRLSVDASVWGGDVGNINYFALMNPPPAPSPITWDKVATGPIAREEANGATVDGKIYLFGGLYGSSYLATVRVDVYDPATDTWSARRPMPQALTHAATVVDGTAVWFIAGYLGNHPGPGTRSVWRYDTVADTWTPGPAFPVAVGAGGAALAGRTIHYFGGKNETRTEESTAHYALDLDDLTAGWTGRTPMPGPGRDHFSTAAAGGYIYAIGGRVGPDEAGTNQAQVDRYDPATDSWTRLGDLPGTISNTAATTFVFDGRIFMLGGETSHNAASDDVWSFDPSNEAWLVHTALPEKRRAGVAGVAGGTIVFTSGWYGGVQSATTWVGTLGDVLGTTGSALQPETAGPKEAAV